MKTGQLSVERGLYLLILLIALGLRLGNLGGTPLSEFEAQGAFQAFQISQGEAAAFGDQPAYLALTSLAFGLLGSGEALARFWPALVGSALVVFPYLLRSKLGRLLALLLALGLAIDPGLVQLSRLAGGPMLAVGFGTLALAAWLAGGRIWAGVLAGLALLSGPSAWVGILGLGAAWLLGRLWGVWPLKADARSDEEMPKGGARDFWLACGSTILLVGTLFLRQPQGLSGLASAFVDFIQGWAESSGVPAAHLLLALVVSQPLALIFGVVAAVRAWTGEKPIGRAMSVWFAAALLIGLAYPSRQVGDLAWAAMPLWALAASEVARSFDWKAEEGLTAWGEAGLVLLLGIFLLLDVLGLGSTPLGTELYTARLWIAAIVVGLGFVATLLIGFGRSARAARQGLAWGVSVFLGLYLLASTSLSSITPAASANVLWHSGPVTGQSDSLIATLGDLSEWQASNRNELDVLVLDEGFAMRWALREMPNVRYVAQLSGDEFPSVVITSETNVEPTLAASYRGQRFAWQVESDWGGVLPPNFPRWLMFREAPVQVEGLLLWARADIFPEDLSTPSEGT